MRRWTGGRSVPWIPLLAIATTGALVQLFATVHGAGISPDSTVYIATARSLMEGRGFQHLGPSGALQPLAVWAPLYPVLLAVGGAVIDLLAWARVLNAVLFGANLLLAGLMIGRYLPSARLAPVIGAGLLLVSEDFATVHGWIWTEPLAIFTAFLGLYWLDRSFAASRATAVIPGAILLGLSCLTRYASLSFVAAALGGVLLLGKGTTWRQRWIRAALLGIFALGPLAAWGIRTLVLTGRVAGRAFQIQNRLASSTWKSLAVVADWILPGRIVGEVREWMAAILLIAWVVGAVAVLAWRMAAPSRRSSYLAELLALFVIAYGLMIGTTTSFLVPGSSLSPRIFSIPYAGILVQTVAHISLCLGRMNDQIAPRRNPALLRWGGMAALGVLLLPWAGFQATHTVKWARSANDDGLGYAALSWLELPLMDYIRELPPGTPIYSNGTDAIHVLTGIAAKQLPDWPGGPATPGATLPAPVGQMRDELVASGGVIVYFRGITWRPTLSEVELSRVLNLVPLFGTDLGSIYGVEP